MSANLISDELADWLRHIQSVHFRSIDLTLDRVRDVYGRLGLGSPKAVVSVAGTNGKGSTVAYLESIYGRAGYKTGAYTSPHLAQYNERIRIAGNPVDTRLILDAFKRIESVRGEIPLTYFEFGTLAALIILDSEAVDVGILEVGMGGRLDAVNIVDADIAVITEIGLDHQQWLGDTREAIAREKAGIMRGGRPVISSGLRPPENLSVHAREIGAELLQLGCDFGYEKIRKHWRWQPLSSACETMDALDNLPLPAGPGVQLQNAAGAVAAVRRLNRQMPVTEADISAGLESVRMPGRCQVIAGHPTVVLDVSHNPDGLAVLDGFLQELSNRGEVHGVFSMLADKAVETALSNIAHTIDHWHIAPVNNERTLTTGDLKNIIRRLSSCPLTEYQDISSAVDGALRDARAEDTVVAFGSFYAVGDIMRHLDINPYSPPPVLPGRSTNHPGI